MEHPYAEVQLRKDGTVHDPAELSAAVDMVKSSGATDALLLVHGWNNDMGAARRLYANLDTSLKAVEPAGAAGRTLAIIGILWPSVKWSRRRCERPTMRSRKGGGLSGMRAIARIHRSLSGVT